MRKTASIGILLAATMSLGACATNDPYDYGYDDRYGRDNTAERAVGGAAIGAAAGAGVGAVVDGVGVGQGAAVGAVAGGIIGAATADRDNNRRWYRDNRGDCYWVDSRGQRVYDYGARC